MEEWRFILVDTLEWGETGRCHGKRVVGIFHTRVVPGPTGRVLVSDAPEGHIHFLIIPLCLAIDFWMEANGEEACQGPEQPAEFHPEPGGKLRTPI